MEDYCDRIPGQHTGRLSLEHQAREAAEWQRKVDDLQKQLDSANRIIRIKDETISLLEKRCNNLREELDELSDRVAVLHDRIIEQNNAIRNAVKASPAAGESALRKLAPCDHVDSMPAAWKSAPTSPEVPQDHGLSEHQLRAIGEAVSALRFCASHDNWYTEARATELRSIANTLAGIEIDAAATPSAADDCVETIQTRTGQEWIVRVSKDLLTISDEHGEILHRSRGHMRTSVYLAMLIDKDRNPPATPSAAVGVSDPGAECSLCGGDGERPDPVCDQWYTCVRCKGTGKEPEEAGASDPVDGDHKEWCDGAKEFCERQVELDTVPRAEYDRVVKLNHHLREVAVMAIIERVPDDSKPKNVHSHESEDTPRGNDVPVSDTVPPEIGKRYVCRNGEVTEAMGAGLRTQTYPFRACVNGVTRTWMRDGKHDESKSSDYDLIAEYREPSPPSESPDVSGEIRGLKYALEWIYVKRAGNPHLKAAALEMLNDMQVAYEAAVDRLQDGEAINSTSQIDLPAESPDDWVTLTDPDHVIRKCDQISDYGTQWYGPSDLTAALGKQYKNCGFKLVRCRRKDMPPVPVVPPPLPSPWRPMTDDYPRDKVLWVARDDGLVYTERNPDEWPLAKAIAWMLAVTPVHPNAAPPVAPKTRTVELMEFRSPALIKAVWSEIDMSGMLEATGRTCECEVPE